MVQLIHRRVWFNGMTSYVTGTDLDINTSFSIGVRFKVKSLPNTTTVNMLVEKGGDVVSANYFLRVDTVGTLFGMVRNNLDTLQTQIFGGTKVNDDVWHYAVLVWDRTAQTLNIYVDAMRDAAPIASAFADLFQNNENFKLGYWWNSSLLGYISDFHIHLRALTESEINYNYLHPNNPSRRDLAVSYTQDSIDQPAAGTWKDRSGNARNGTMTACTTSKYPSISAGRNALFFPTAAGSDRVDCGNGASLNPTLTGLISGEFWFKTARNVAGVVVGIADKIGAGNGYQFYYDRGSKTLILISGPGAAIQSVAINDFIDGSWKHVAFTHTGGAATGEIYVNGINKTATRTVRALANSATNLLIGNTNSLVYAPVGGYIPAARLYNSILTAEEVNYNFKHPNNPKRRGLVLNLSQESLYGTRWQDLSGNANHGTITGALPKNIADSLTGD